MSWEDAREICKELQPTADLTSVHSLQEHSFITEHFRGNRWFGLNDRAKEGTFVWSNGEPLDFTFWYCGEPNDLYGSEDCVDLGKPQTHWNDNDCNKRYKFVCRMRLA
ncbi:Lectin BRA-3 [Amphibalanus amphitrite]|uniref:Lectin BRA-3 n=1 Tax=Amphibalanus amphitrite TaxID=1232801 RepID=A0A6A4XD03_AMPAM|nr:Lectin BRA-3 [Amphibalanus amphitrite]